MDEGLRRAERAAAVGDPQARQEYLTQLRRRGEPVPALEYQAFETDPRQRMRWLLQAHAEQWPRRDAIENEHREALARIELRYGQALRRLDPRIRRSKRTGFNALVDWAATVAGGEAVNQILEPLEAERDAEFVRARGLADAWTRDDALINRLLHQVAWVAEPEHGDLEVEHAFSSADTYRSSGRSAGSSARSAAQAHALFLASQGFPSRIEREPGRVHEGMSRGGRPETFTAGNGFRVFTWVLEPLDGQILKYRGAGWKHDQNYLGHEAFMAMPHGELNRRMRERFDMLPTGMPVERMLERVRREGPLRPSWLLTTRPNPWRLR